MADKRILLAGGGANTLATRDDLENRFWSFFQRKRNFSGPNAPKKSKKPKKPKKPTPINPPPLGGGKPGKKDEYVPLQRSAIWWPGSASANLNGATGNLGRPHTYTPWVDATAIMTSFWFRTYNHTDPNYVKPNLGLFAYTYNGAWHDGPRYNSIDGKCELYSWKYTNGVQAGFWDDDITTMLGAAGDGTGDFTEQEWHHMAFWHAYNGYLWIDGVRTFYGHHDNANWTCSTYTNNAWQDIHMVLGGLKGINEKPPNAHWGLSNVWVFHGASMVDTEFDSVKSLDPVNDTWRERAVAYMLRTPAENTKSGLLWAYPLQTDVNDVGPYGKHLNLANDATIAVSNGTYDGPIF